MQNIALVYPEFRTPTFWSFKESLKILKKRVNMPPYGLLTIAGMLPNGFDPALYDENIRPVSDEELSGADLVMASAMIMQEQSLQELIGRCNRLGVPILVGGPLINSGFEHVRDADHYFIGEAEHGLARFLADWCAGKAKKAYGHVADSSKAARIRAHFRGEAALIIGERPELAKTSLPRFDLLEHSQYGSMAVQFSRGCPVGCEFCDIWAQYGRKPRIKSVDRLLAELNAIRALGYEGALFIIDDNFIGNKKAVKGELLPALVRWQREAGYPFKFFAEATITMADDEELLSLMHDAGFDMVFVGIETPDERSLIETNKALNTDFRTHNTSAKLHAQIEKVQRAGIEVCTVLIVGFDSEPGNIADMMSTFIQEARIPLAMAGLLTALPETDLEARLASEGRLRMKSVGNNTHAFEMNFVPKRPETDVVASYKHLLELLYDKCLKSYFERCDGFLDRVGYNAGIERTANFKNLRILIRSFFHIVPTSHGWNYLTFLARRFVKDRRTFAEAVAFGIKGHHLAHITRCALEVHEINQYCRQLLEQVDEYLARLKSSYRQGKARMEETYNAKKDALLQARRRFRKMKRTSRANALESYKKYVREICDRFETVERMMYPGQRPTP